MTVGHNLGGSFAGFKRVRTGHCPENPLRADGVTAHFEIGTVQAHCGSGLGERDGGIKIQCLPNLPPILPARQSPVEQHLHLLFRLLPDGEALSTTRASTASTSITRGNRIQVNISVAVGS